MVSALVLTMLFAFAGCKALTSYQLIKNAVDKTNKLDSYEMNMTTEIEMDFLGQNMKMPTTYNVKASGIQSGKPIASGTMKTTMFDTELSYKIYTDGVTAYLDVMDKKAKASLEEEGAETYDLIDQTNDVVKELPEEILKEVEIVKNEDGTSTVSFILDEETFSKVFKDLSDKLSNNNEDGEESATANTEVKVSDINVTIVVTKDGYIKSYDMSFKMDITVHSEDDDVLIQDMTTSMNVKVSAEYVNPGQNVTVDVPENLDEYVDISELQGDDVDNDIDG